MKHDYPTDVYYSIYKYIDIGEFPILGCWKLSDNSRKAIMKLGYNKCPYHGNNGKPIYLKTTKLKESEISIVDCDICHVNHGFMCCEFYTDSLIKCDICSKLVCKQCSELCKLCLNKYCSLCCITGCNTCFTTICFKCDKKKTNHVCV